MREGVPPGLAQLFASPHDEAIQDMIYRRLIESGGGAEDAFRVLKQQRHRDPRNPILREAEHALFSQSQVDERGPFGKMGVALSVPAYSGLKAGVRALPPPAARLWDMIRDASGLPLPASTSSKPSLSEIKWGLAPLWGGVPNVRHALP